MTVKTSGHYFVSIFQESKRKMLSYIKDYEYSEARLVILQKKSNQYYFVASRATFQSSSTSNSQVCGVDVLLEAG